MRNAVPLEVKYAACDGAARAKEWVVGGAMCDTLAFHRILLVSERERDLRHTIDVRVIQRCDDGSVDVAAQSKAHSFYFSRKLKPTSVAQESKRHRCPLH